MAVITREITLDVSRANVFHAVIAKQHDANSRFLKATIADLGVKISVPMGAVVMLNATRSDKQKHAFLGDVNADGTVTVPLTSWLLELDGKAICDISIVAEDGSRLTTMKFALEIEPASCANSDVAEDENYDLLISLLSDVSESKAQEISRVRSEQVRITAEQNRARAEAARVGNESNRDANEYERTKSENTRTYNEQRRINGEILREETEQARITAETARTKSENTRIYNEQRRINGEILREETEQTRITAESARVEYEQERNYSEQRRMEGEIDRADAELQRAEAEIVRTQNEAARRFGLGEIEHYLGLPSAFTSAGGFTEHVSVPSGASRHAKIAKLGGYTHRYHYESGGRIYDEANAVHISAIKDQNGTVLLSIPDVNGMVGLGNNADYANYIFFEGGKAYFRQGCRLASFVDGNAPQPEAGETVRESYPNSACVIELADPIVSDISDLFGKDSSGLLDLEGVTELSFEIAGFTHEKESEECGDGVIGYYDADAPFGMGLFEIVLTSGADGMQASQNLGLKAQLKSYCEQLVEDELRDVNTGIKRYGVRFGGSGNTGDGVERLYDAVGFVAGVGTDTAAPLNDFDHVFPWNARRRCCGEWDENGNFVVNAYCGEPGYAEDGSNGEVWVEHSLFYFKHECADDGTEIVVISPTKLEGYAPAPIFQRRGNYDAPDQKAYTAAFPMATVDGKGTSRAGVFSGVYSLNTGMATARTLGERYTTTTMAEQYTECLYMWVEFATRHMQSVMSGATNMPYSASDTATIAETGTNRVIVLSSVASKFTIGQTIGIGSALGSADVANDRIVTAIEAYDDKNTEIRFDGEAVNIAVGDIVFTLAWKNGACNSVIASSGSPVSNTDGKHNCVYRGKEMPYGNAYEWISDVLFKREGEGTDDSPYVYHLYYLPDPTKYANGAITEDYVKINYNASAENGYVKAIGVDTRFPWVRMPSAIGAASNTYYSDSYYYPRAALCAALVGGNWTCGSSAGPCSWYCSYEPSRLIISCRGRLSYHGGS